MLECDSPHSRKDESQEYLIEKIKQGKIDRVGATVDPDRRLGEYRREGYRGTMVFAKTENMKKAENRILEACKSCTRNVHSASNATENAGYVYGIES
jgi:hypothetical protein